jgi:hypothetical protein
LQEHRKQGVGQAGIPAQIHSVTAPTGRYVLADNAQYSWKSLYDLYPKFIKCIYIKVSKRIQNDPKCSKVVSGEPSFASLML